MNERTGQIAKPQGSPTTPSPLRPFYDVMDVNGRRTVAPKYRGSLFLPKHSM